MAVVSTGPLPSRLRFGSLIVLAGGLVPLCVSSILFVAYVWSEMHPSSPWLSGQVLPRPASYTLNDIRRFSQDVATAFVTAQHIELANVMNTGAVIAALAWFGLRRYQRWAWYTLLGAALWPGLNDAAAVLAAHEPPAPVVGEAIVLFGLWLAHGPVFAGPADASGPQSEKAAQTGGRN